jgi:hypothetical protein
MKATIDLFPQGIIDQSFLVKVREWAGEVIEKIEPRAAQDPISIYLWEEEWEARILSVPVYRPIDGSWMFRGPGFPDLKIRLPIETLAGLGLPESGLLQEKWEAAYAWLTDQGKKALKAYVRKVLESPHKYFQDRLERTALGLINNFAS